MDFKPSLKQHECFTYLGDKTTNEIMYGGAAGGGKTHLACIWVIMSALKYPDTRYLIGRARYSTLSKTTLLSFQQLLSQYGLTKQAKYNNQNHIFTFNNGSKVFFQDLYYYPSDPDMNALRGYELTAVVLDEGAEIPYKAYEILFNTRIRYNLDKYGLVPKILICSNPTKNWLYDRYYVPWRDDNLPDNIKYIQSTCEDNPHLPQSYIDGLKNSTELMKQIYYHGNWEYNTSELNLFEHEKLMNSFYHPIPGDKTKYITADIAMGGKDKTIITYWEGLNCMEIHSYDSMDTISNVEAIKGIMKKHGVRIQNVIIDSVGVGVGVADLLKGCVKFQASAKALKGENYANIRTQFFYKLAELVYYGQIYIKGGMMIERITQELEAHQKHKIDSDKGPGVTPKEQVKKSINRSPDIADALSMRMWWEYKSNKINISVI